MTRLIPLTPERHSGKFWKRYNSYRFAARDNLTPLVAAEIPKAAQNMPMAFIRQNDKFMLVGILSLAPGMNLFVNPEGKWIGGYVPSHFRSYPFRLAPVEGRDGLVLCVDEDSELVNDTQGEAFFDEARRITRPVNEVLNFLTQIEKNRILTDSAVQAMADVGLFKKWDLKIKIGQQEKPMVGLYHIDEARLNSLDDNGFLTLRKSQSLALAYAQLLSMANMTVFNKPAMIGKPAPQKQPIIPDVGDILIGDDDMIKF